ncbi:hypothetical protein HMPREF0208_03714 [Citrobacter koseri]|nr:hypothetical protein HMPREF0208_03714 [Citrobacter koseri]
MILYHSVKLFMILWNRFPILRFIAHVFFAKRRKTIKLPY